MASFSNCLKTYRNSASFYGWSKAVTTDFLCWQTIVVSPYMMQIRKSRYNYIPLDIEQNQLISSSEAIRLKTFLDEFYLESVNTNLFSIDSLRQIGNAVSVFLFRRMTVQIKGDWGV